MALLIILAVAAAVAIGYLTYHRGLKEAVAVVAAFGAALAVAFNTFVHAFF